MDETIQVIDQSIQTGRKISHVVVNASKIVSLQKDQELAKSVNSCDIISADGQSVVWASRILRLPLKERVTGIDLMENLVELAHRKKYKIFFLGGSQNVVERTVEHYVKKYSQDIIAGYRNGYFSYSESSEIAKAISNKKPDILFVAISSPKKEKFLYNHRALLESVSFTMGVGGSFDVVAGVVKRAPLWMQKRGLEWFFRLIQEPKRMWKRYLIGNTKFIKLVIREKMLN